MAPDDEKIEECIYISHIRTCESNVFEPGHRLVIHLDTNEHMIFTMIIILATKNV
jgi:hypothetical protein